MIRRTHQPQNPAPVAPEKSLPLVAIQPGKIYVCMGHEIVRVTAIGKEEFFGKRLPDCIGFDVLGMTELWGAWWQREWLVPEKDARWADRIYFSLWDGNGILFGSEKAKKMHVMISTRLAIGWDYRSTEGKPDSKAHAIAQRKVTLWDNKAEALFASRASTDPDQQPAVLPPPPKEFRLPVGILRPLAPTDDPWDNL